MKFVLDTKYSEAELEVIKKHNCEIVSEIKLSKFKFSENETPRRILKYCGTYVAEICDDESNELVWAVLSKWKGVYHFSGIYGTLDMLEQGL